MKKKASGSILFFLLIPSLLIQNWTPSANAATAFSINYQSEYANWTFTIPNVGAEGLLTDTPYKLTITAKSTAAPDYYNSKILATGCKIIPLYDSKPDYVFEPVIWSFYGNFAINGVDGPLLVEDPSLETPQKLNDFFLQEFYTDMNNKHYLRGTDDRSKYYKLLSDGSVTRKVPVSIKFDEPGIYNMNIHEIIWQIVEPVEGNRNCNKQDFSLSPGFEVVNTVANIPFGTVNDKNSAQATGTEIASSTGSALEACIKTNNEIDLLKFKLNDAISKMKLPSKMLYAVLKNAPSKLKCSSAKKIGFDIELKGKQKIVILYKKTVNAAITKVKKSG